MITAVFLIDNGFEKKFLDDQNESEGFYIEKVLCESIDGEISIVLEEDGKCFLYPTSRRFETQEQVIEFINAFPK